MFVLLVCVRLFDGVFARRGCCVFMFVFNDVVVVVLGMIVLVGGVVVVILVLGVIVVRGVVVRVRVIVLGLLE